METGSKPIEIIALVISIFAGFHAQVAGVRIAISHVNDVSGQIQTFEKEIQWSAKAPIPCEKDQLQCIGGLVNMVHWLHDNTGFEDVLYDANTLRLSSGNLIGGESGWIPSVSNGWGAYGELVRDHIQPTVLALGMKDFGAGLSRTISYMNVTRSEKFTLANTCEDNNNYTGVERDFCNLLQDPIKRLEVYDTDGMSRYPIGIIGFVTPTVERLSLPGKLKFADIVTKIKEKVEASAEIKTFIALGDGNLDIAKQILDQVPKVKLVIYGAGFANTLNMTDQYPLPYNNGFIATAGRYGSSVGKLVLDIDRVSGDVTVVNGNLIATVRPEILNPPASRVPTALYSWEATVRENKLNIRGHTRVDLVGGNTCWRQECNLGNLMADAVVHCTLQKFSRPFPYPLHSLWHGGAFFHDTFKAGNNISKFDIHQWLPYHNNVHLVRVQGQHLRQILQISASGIDPEKVNAKDWAQFLQVSRGLEVHYDVVSESDAINVTRVRVEHDDNGVPQLGDLRDNEEYYMVIPTYLYEGRGLYEFATGVWVDVTFDSMSSSLVGFDDDCLASYITALHQVSVGIEERIKINRDGGSISHD